MVRSQVRRGRPGRRLQSLGNPQIDVYRALDVSMQNAIIIIDDKPADIVVYLLSSLVCSHLKLVVVCAT